MNAPLLRSFGPNIWLVDGTETEVFGFRYPTRMAVVKLADRGLVIWSPIKLSNTLRDELAVLGAVRHLIAPNSLHHVFLSEWQSTYPSARLSTAPGLREKRRDLVIATELDDRCQPDWSGELDCVLMRGNRITTEAVFFHRESGTVLFTDLLQQFPRGWFTGWRAIVARLDLMTAPEPTVPRKFRFAFTDRLAARDALSRILAWPVHKVVMAHGKPVETDGRALIMRAFHWLTH